MAITVVGAASAVIGLDRPAASLGIVAIVLLIALATIRSATMSGASALLLLVAVLSLVPWFAIRTSPWLLVPDAIAVVALAAVGLSMRNGAGAIDSPAGYLRRARQLAAGVIETPRHVHLGVRTTVPAGWRQAVRQTVVPGLVGLSAAVIVSGVLASGDAVFASYLDVGGAFGSLPGRFASAAVAMLIVAIATGGAIVSERRQPLRSKSFSSPRAAMVAMLPLCAVYVGFVIVQCSSVLLGADYVRRRTGLTFAEYARSGFFQLVSVALVTFIGLLVLRPTVRTAAGRSRTVLRLLAVVATLCTIAMSAAAIVKLDLYADVFGLTMLRMFTTVFAGWLAIALLIALAALFRLRGEWVVPAVAATALCGVLAMNVVNPERLVAEHNLTDTIGSDEFDIHYLLDLSDDAVPSIVEHFDDLTAGDQAIARNRLCRGGSREVSGLDWNWSANGARSAADSIC